MKEFKNLKRIAIEELEKLDAKYANKSEFAPEDAKTYECMMHGLKCHLTAEAMMEAEEYGEEEGADGFSERRGRSSVTGRYISREGRNSYADGYSEGYSEGMRQSYNGRGMSGHWPPMPYPERYRY